jgi:hypothetical protein
MSWTAPLTAVPNATITAAEWNAHVRDNLAETCASKASAANEYFVTTAANAIATRSISSARVDSYQTTTSASYADLATPGPSVSVNSGTSAIVWFSAEAYDVGIDVAHKFSVAVSGATTLAASDDWCVLLGGIDDDSPCRRGVAHRFTGLTSGVNTFTMKYATASNTATFALREIIAMPF